MNRPKINPEKSKIDYLLEFTTLFIYILFLGLVIWNYQDLPNDISVNFNWPNKDENGMINKTLIFAPILLSTFLGAGIYKLNQYPWLFNYLVTITEKNAAFQYKYATKMLRTLNLMIVLIFGLLSLQALLETNGIRYQGLDILIKWFPALMISIPLIFLIKMNSNNSN